MPVKQSDFEFFLLQAGNGSTFHFSEYKTLDGQVHRLVDTILPDGRTRYKQDLLGQSLEFRRTVQSGITSPESGTGVERSNGKDGFTVDFYSSIGVELRAANNHGLLYAA